MVLIVSFCPDEGRMWGSCAASQLAAGRVSPRRARKAGQILDPGGARLDRGQQQAVPVALVGVN